MTEVGERIEEALESVRPYLKTDGGDVKFIEITDDMEVRVELLGACSSCSMSDMTMKAGIEEAIRKVVPNLKSVVAI